MKQGDRSPIYNAHEIEPPSTILVSHNTFAKKEREKSEESFLLLLLKFTIAHLRSRE